MPAVLGEIFINLIQRLVDDFKLTDVKQINTALAGGDPKKLPDLPPDHSR